MVQSLSRLCAASSAAHLSLPRVSLCLYRVLLCACYMSATSPVLIITDSGGCGNDLDVDGQSVVFGTARLRTVTSSAACDCYVNMCLLIACCVRERERDVLPVTLVADV